MVALTLKEVGISLADNMLGSISDLGYFCSRNSFFNSLKRFSFTFSFSTMVHILLARENGIFVTECGGWFDLKEIYHFESVGLLKISIQIFVPLTFIIMSKKGYFSL